MKCKNTECTNYDCKKRNVPICHIDCNEYIEKLRSTPARMGAFLYGQDKNTSFLKYQIRKERRRR